MIDKNKLRGSDIISGGLFGVLGIYILIESFQMPLSDSYGGVTTHWYVSPALMPIIIGIGMILLAIAIIVNGIRNGGKEQLEAERNEKKGKPFIDDNKIRFYAVMLPLVSIVFINLNTIDFYLNAVMYLLFTTCFFYLEDMVFLKKGITIATVFEIIIAALHFSGVDRKLTQVFFASMDLIGLAAVIVMNISLIMYAKKAGNEVYMKKAKHIMLVSYIMPLLIVPLFKFALRVPMPHEGGFINLMSMVYYALR